MNMKALLKELVKDPQIKALYKESFDRSLINKLIVESLMEQDKDIQIPDSTAINNMYNDEKEQLKQKLIKINRSGEISNDIKRKAKEALRDIRHSVDKPRPEGQKAPTQPETSPDTKGKKSGRKYNKKQAALTKLGKEYPFKTIVSALNAQNNFENIKYLIDQALSHEGIKDEKQQKQAVAAVQNAIEKNDNLQPEQKKELKQNVEFVAQEKFELVPMKLIQSVAEKFKNLTSEQKNEILIEVSFILVDDKPEAKEKVSSALVKLGVKEETAIAIVNNKQAIEQLQNALQKTDSQGQTEQLQKLLKGLYDAVSENDDINAKQISTQIYDMIKDIKGFDEIVNLAKQGDEKTLEEIKKSYIETYDQYEQALDLKEQKPKQLGSDEQDEGTKKKFLFAVIVALYNAYNREPAEEPKEEPTEEPGQPIPSSGTISPKEYAKLYDANLEEAFDTFEDNFLRTPFLSKQSEVLITLKDAVSQFSKELSKKEKQSFSRTADQDTEVLQEQEEKYPIIKFDPKDQKLIMVEHKMMKKYLKMLVKMVTDIDPEKINTVGFEQDSRKIRAIAKQLLESIIDLMKIIDSAQKEERKGIEFKEVVIREEEATDDKKPRTQLTRDQIIDLMEQSYDLIVDYGTNIERESRTEKEAIELKPVEDAIEKLNQVFAKILPYFPAHSPFGKTASLKEIKKQVRGISRDIIQVMKQAKGLAEKPENFDEQGITTFAAVLLSTVDKLQKYFDLEIDDAEIKAMLPKVPPAKSASYGKDSEGIFNRIQDIIKQYSPKVQAQAKKIYKQYSPEVQKALQNGMGWAERHAKTLGEKAKPYLDKVKQAFKEAGQIAKEVWEILSKGGIEFGDLNLTKEDAKEVMETIVPQFHPEVLKAVVEWEPEGLEKYYDTKNEEVPIERQKDILESFFQQMKGEYMTEAKVFLSKQLQNQGIDRKTAIKASNSYKEIKDEFLPSERKWLIKTLVKMAKEDSDLFMQLSGRVSEKESEKTKLKPEDKEKLKDAVKEELPQVVNNLEQDEINKDEIITQVTQTDEVQSAFKQIELEADEDGVQFPHARSLEDQVEIALEEIEFEEEFDSEEFEEVEMTLEELTDMFKDLPTSPNNSKLEEKQSNNNDDDESRQIQRKIEKIIEHYLKTGKL